MKILSKAITLIAVATITLVMFSTLVPTYTRAQAVVKGPPLDVMYWDVRTSQDVGIGDAAEGITDVFMWSASPAVFKRLPLDILEKLKLVRAASGYWSLVFNPVQDDPSLPGVVNATGAGVEGLHFNPFALREVRYTMNWIFSRKYIIEEILAAGGAPMYSPVQPSNPSHAFVSDVYPALGLTPEGDFRSANATIDAVLTAVAADLSAQGYQLYKKTDPTAPAGYWWTFKAPREPEETVTVRFAIRIEDERHEEGLYIANQIEKVGIKVERLERDRDTCTTWSYRTDPKDYLWNIYTEGWVSMSDFKYREASINQMVAPWYGYMPGRQVTGWWQYENSTVDEIGQKIYFGPFATADEYWDATKDTVELGILESVRVFVCETWEYFAANPRVTNMAYGTISGLWPCWPLRTATTADKILKVTEYSAAGVLFMSSWNPILGFEDVYSELIWRYMRDYADYPHPMTGEPIPVRTTWQIEKQYHLEDDTVVGDMIVPATALTYNATNDEWESVGAGNTAIAKVVYNYMMSNWHHGEPMTIADVMYNWGFMYEWSTEDVPGDPYYYSLYATLYEPTLETIKGIEILNSTAIAIYGDYIHAVSDPVTADYYAMWPQVPWEVMAAMEEVVVNGGPVSGDTYGWYEEPGIEWIDMLIPDHVTDIEAAMSSLDTAGYIPPYCNIAGYTPTADEADARYTAALDWTDTYGHVAISNGPYWLYRYLPDIMFLELRAFRDETYPFGPTYWQANLFLQTMKIRRVEAPTEITAGESIPISVYPILRTEFPVPKEELATTGYIETTLENPAGAEVYTGVADYLLPGLFSTTIPKSITEGLPEGSYTIEVSAAVEKGLFADVRTVPVIISGVPPIKYKLTIQLFELGTGTTDPSGAPEYSPGTTVTVTCSPADGYEFDYWELDGVKIGTEESATVTMGEPHRLVAHLKEIPAFAVTTELAVSIVAILISLVAVAATLMKRTKPT